MKKLRRNIMSGFFLFVILMLLELMIILFVHFFMDNYIDYFFPDVNTQIIVGLVWTGIRIIESIVTIIIFFRILNKQELCK